MSRRFTLVLATAVLFALGAAAAEETEQRIRAGVQRLNDAFISQDYGTVADLTYPKVVQMLGGREQMIKSLTEAHRQLSDEGMSIEGSIVDGLSDVVIAGSEMHVLVHATTSVRILGGTLKQKTFLLGVSSDNGRSWSFLDGAMLTEENLPQLFPEFNPALKLPPREDPQFEPDR